jgi:hypothetical protein
MIFDRLGRVAYRPDGEENPPAGATRATGDVKPKVIYVMGAGRSGSTILGVALGNCTDVFFAGELDRWLVRSGVPTSKRQQVGGFWAEILARMGDQGDLFGGQSTALERSSALFDPRRWSRRARLRARYRRSSEHLYRAIASTRAVSYVVDTSHYPLRARELQTLAGIELYLLYLVRDPRSVVRSMGRRDVRERTLGPWRANAYLWLTSALSVLVFLRQPRERRMLIRYEDLLADPAPVLANILRQCGSDASPPRLARLETGLPFHGNRLVEQDIVGFEAQASSTPRGGVPTSLIQLPWSALARCLKPRASAR